MQMISLRTVACSALGEEHRTYFAIPFNRLEGYRIRRQEFSLPQTAITVKLDRGYAKIAEAMFAICVVHKHERPIALAAREQKKICIGLFHRAPNARLRKTAPMIVMATLR